MTYTRDGFTIELIGLNSYLDWVSLYSLKAILPGAQSTFTHIYTHTQSVSNQPGQFVDGRGMSISFSSLPSWRWALAILSQLLCNHRSCLQATTSTLHYLASSIEHIYVICTTPRVNPVLFALEYKGVLSMVYSM